MTAPGSQQENSGGPNSRITYSEHAQTASESELTTANFGNKQAPDPALSATQSNMDATPTMNSKGTKPEMSLLDCQRSIFSTLWNDPKSRAALIPKLIIATVESVLVFVPPVILGSFVDSLSHQNLMTVIAPGATILATWAAQQWVAAVRPRTHEEFRVRSLRTLENEYFKKIGSRSLQTLHSEDYQSALTGTRDNFYRMFSFSDGTIQFASNSISFVGAAIFFCQHHIFTGAVFLAAGLLQYFVEYKHGKELYKLSVEQQEKRSAYWWQRAFLTIKDTLTELVNNRKLSKAQEAVAAIDEGLNEQVSNTLRRRERESFIPSLAFVAATAIGLATIATQVWHGSVNAGAALSAFWLMASMGTSIFGVSKNIGYLMQDYNFVERILRIDKLGQADRDPSKNYRRLDPLVVPEIRLENVGYTKEKSEWNSETGRKEKIDFTILNGISLTLEPGKFYGICGPSGSGKTSMVRLITLQDKPTSGRIYINGIDLNEVDPDDVRKVIGFMPQNSHSFASMTVRDSIKIGSPPAPEASPINLSEAAIRSDIDFLKANSKHDPYDAHIALGGKNARDFSGGELQRFSLARLHMHGASVIIADEPTAHLDHLREEAVFANLRLGTTGVTPTTVVISHRFANLIKADKIFFIDKGRVAEEGAHDELIKLNGLYASNFIKESGPYVSQKIEGVGK